MTGRPFTSAAVGLFLVVGMQGAAHADEPSPAPPPAPSPSTPPPPPAPAPAPSSTPAPSADDQDAAEKRWRAASAEAPGRFDVAALEKQGVTIGYINIRTIDVFDESDPAQNRGFYRAVNTLHIKTREQTVRNNLLFAVGDPLSRERLEETERNLRALPFISHASCEVVDVQGNQSTVLVTTQDSWTTRLGARLGIAGGASKSGLNLAELNVLGMGKRIDLIYESDPDRSTHGVGYDDLNVLGSHHRFSAEYRDTSDGTSEELRFELPFYSFDTKLAYGVHVYHAKDEFSIYEGGDRIGRFDHRNRSADGWIGWSRGEQQGTVARWLAGYAFISNDYDAQQADLDRLADNERPLSLTAAGPYVGYQWTRNQYIKVRYFERFSRYEDYNLGTNINLRLQASRESFGGTGNDFVASMQASKGLHPGPFEYVLGEAELKGRVGGIGRGLAHVTMTSYYTAWPNQTFVIRTEAGRSFNQGASERFQLGGDNGLHGYDIRRFDGPNLVLLNLEDRFHLNKEYFHAVRFGGAVFFDAGNAWGGTREDEQSVCMRDPNPPNRVTCDIVNVTRPNSFGNIKADVGFAILADIRPASGSALVRVNVAFPINGGKYDQGAILFSVGDIGF